MTSVVGVKTPESDADVAELSKETNVVVASVDTGEVDRTTEPVSVAESADPPVSAGNPVLLDVTEASGAAVDEELGIVSFSHSARNP